MASHLDIELSPPSLHGDLMRLTPVERAQAAANAMDHYRAAIRMLGVVRRKAIRALVDDGESAASVAAKLGVTRQQVHRLLQEDDPRPIYELQPSLDGKSWIVSNLSEGGATKFPDKDKAIAQAFRWAKHSGGIVVRATAGGGTEELPTPD